MKEKPHWFRWILLTVGGVLLIVKMTHPLVPSPSWGQPTMGTLCHITLSSSLPDSVLKALRREIDAELQQVNQRMSTWQSDTEISQFNKFQSLDPFPVSPEFAGVVRHALEISAETDGAFDPTVKPLVDHWGFGPEADTGLLAEIMKTVGWEKVVLAGNSLSKKEENLQLDLSAIAKGYGVDAVADVIRSFDLKNFLVEIGGEIVASGLNPDQKPWRVGVESPQVSAAYSSGIFRTLELLDEAMATSGDYRNFRTREDGTRFSHIIDPRTGQPSETDIASVSVLAGSCMEADAAATALFVMGSKKGMEWLLARRELDGENRSELEAFFILHTTNQTFTTRATSGFPE